MKTNSSNPVGFMLRYGGLGLIGAALAVWVGSTVFFNLPVSTDEGSYLFQTYTFREGRLTRPYPPMGSLIRRPNDMIIMDTSAGWVSRYPPGHALWLLPGALAGEPRVMVWVACAGSMMLVMLLAKHLGGIALFAGLILLLSPFYLIMHGTLFSHTSGFFSVCLMLLGYVRLQQTGRHRYAILAGSAWSLLFLNRTYTAFLIAIPFAVDALIQLARNRNRDTRLNTIYFGASACAGVVLYLIYNALITGDPRVPTYLLYDATQTLGFGMRHLQGLPVNHSFTRGLSNAWENIRILDVWVIGLRFTLPLLIVLGLIGWSQRWALILWGAPLALVAGYVFFWFPGPRHIGPAYYFEGIPFLVILAAMGVKRIGRWLRIAPKPLSYGAVAIILLLAAGSAARFTGQQKRYFNATLASQRILAQTLDNAPANSLVFLHDIQYPPFGKITVNQFGINSDPLVLSHPHPAYLADVMSFFPDHTPYLIHGFAVDQLLELDLKDLPARSELTVSAADLLYFTGVNEKSSTGDIIRVARENRDAEHYLAYGFYRSLTPGDYRARFHIYHASGTEPGASRLDVAADFGLLQLAVMPVTYVPEASVEELEFTIPGKDFLRVEPRVFYGGTGKLAVSRIEIETIQ